MKKISGLLLLVLLAFTLSGCEKAVEEISFKVIAPIGSPALAQTYMESTLPSLGDHVTYEIEVVSGTDPLIAAFASGTHEIIYAPTNLGAKLISTGLEYQFAGTVVWGNLYLATGTDDAFSMSDLDGKEIVAFGQNSTPDIVLQTILADQTFTTAPTITYVDSAGTALATLAADPTKIVMLAEPVLSVAALPSKVANLKSIDLQVAWEDMTGDSSYPQAGIFVKTGFDSTVLDDYLAQVVVSINQAATDPAGVAQMAVDLDYGFPLPVLTSAIPRSNLMFKSALDSKDALEKYFGYIMDFNPVLIGGSLPDEDFYYVSTSVYRTS